LNVRLGTLDDSITEPTAVSLADGSTLVVEPLVRNRGRLGLKDFDPCTILLNNDLSAGLPSVLEGLHEQYLLPPLHAGWAVRRKTKHFAAYEEVAKKFAKLLGMDHWLINPMFGRCDQINFTTGEGTEALVSQADALLGQIRRKYKEYGVQEKPFLIVKADAGTYGMGIMTVRDPKDLLDLNRRARNKMSVIKDGQEVSEVILQEGVPTFERVGEAVAEPVVYMIDRYVVGGFYRVNADRGIDENLNSPGATFMPMALAEPLPLPKPGDRPVAQTPNRFYMYGVIARLAMLAASYELEATDPGAEANQ
jgi:glutamate--cysteine ligase